MHSVLYFSYPLSSSCDTESRVAPSTYGRQPQKIKPKYLYQMLALANLSNHISNSCCDVMFIIYSPNQLAMYILESEGKGNLLKKSRVAHGS